MAVPPNHIGGKRKNDKRREEEAETERKAEREGRR
jgi:hypothetical protein